MAQRYISKIEQEKMEKDVVYIARRDAVLAILNLRGKYSLKGKAFETLIVRQLENLAEQINGTELKLVEAREEAKEVQVENKIDGCMPMILITAALIGIAVGGLIWVALNIPST